MAQQRQLAWPTYLVAFLLAFLPVFDQTMTLLPLRLAEAKWRFGAFGLLSNSLIFPVVGMMIAIYAMGVFEHRRAQRAIGIVGIVLAIAILGAVGMFGLDVLQIRGEVSAKAKLAFEVASLTAGGKGLLAAILFGGFGFAALKGPKAVRAVAKEPRGGLIMGAPIAARPAIAKPEPISVPLPETMASLPDKSV